MGAFTCQTCHETPKSEIIEKSKSENKDEDIPICDRVVCKNTIPGFDYKTSNMIGHKYIPTSEVMTKTKLLNIPLSITGTDCIIKQDMYKTTNELGWKHNDLTFNSLHRPTCVPASSVHYIKNCMEKLKVKPIIPPRIPTSEYKDKYLCHNSYDTITVNLSPKLHCQMYGVGKDQCLEVYPVDEGILQHLDPYNSTTHTDYKYIPQAQVDKYKSTPIEFRPQNIKRSIFDKAVFSKPVLNKYLYKPHKTLPHIGMESETKSSYRYPLDEFVNFHLGVKCSPRCHPASKAEIFATPAMYMTEYSHISRSWPVNAAVDTYKNGSISIDTNIHETGNCMN